MPRLDGIEAARTILEERPIPIVMLTAYGQDELVSRAVEAGVYNYLVKPFREADLLPAIATARARHEELASLREEADSLAEALAARKAIERAKGLLMARGLVRGGRFQAASQGEPLSGKPLKVVASARHPRRHVIPWGQTPRASPRPSRAPTRLGSDPVRALPGASWA